MPNMDPKKCPMPSQEPNVRNKNFKEVALGYTEEMAVNEAKRCLQCKNHPCRSGCPVEIDIPGFIKQQKQSLSQAVMETLAVIAYRQPVTKAEIELIRGVKCDYSVQMLVSRGLIEEVGRKEALGRPILYGTTDAFLRHFCLTSLGDLPEIDFSALAEKIAEAEAKQASEAPKADPVDKLAQNIAKEKG